MLWIDIATPKYALFFSKMIPALKKLDAHILVTTRHSNSYDEVTKILELLQLDHIVLGNYGGASVKEKFNARLKRQSEFVDIFEANGYPDALICGSSVEGVQTAFGLGIPVIHFADTPIKGHAFAYEDITILSRLTIPLSSLIFHPFVIPGEVYTKMGVAPENVISHGFIDVCLWMDDIEKKEENDFRVRYGLDTSKPTVLIREEEYKAHYVKEQLPIIYDAVRLLSEQMDANIVIMPRYESGYLTEQFSDIALILEEKLAPEAFYPFIDLLIGGGGTMNLEASYYGIPVISTRSLHLYHDRYLIENGLMYWSDDTEEVVRLAQEHIGEKRDNSRYFCPEKCDFAQIIDRIGLFLQSRRGEV